MEKKTQITFYSGLDTVGGVVMELVYHDHRLIMEMGCAYNPAFDLFDGSVNIRNQYLKDCLWIGDACPIHGLYDANRIQKTGLQPAKKDAKTAVLITHLHLDHMKNMGLVSDDVDVYLSKKAQKIQEVLVEVGEGIVTYRHHYFDISNPLIFGEIKVTPFVLNDDSYQDYSFYIETPDLKLHYTGDVFVYGVYQENLIKEARFLNEQQIDILVCEGTSFLPSWLQAVKDPQLTGKLKVDGVIEEKEMLDHTEKLIHQAKGLVFFNIYLREICHIKNWLELAQKTNRIIVFEPKAAYLISKVLNQTVCFMIPDTYDPDNYPAYLQYLIQNNPCIEKTELLQNPALYLLQNSYENLLELLDYRHIETLYLHHSGTPLGSYDPAFQRMMSIIDYCHIRYHHIEYTEKGKFFSHAVAQQILWYIDLVNPKLLVPSHCPNRVLEAEKAQRPYYLCQNQVTYTYDRKRNTLQEEE